MDPQAPPILSSSPKLELHMLVVGDETRVKLHQTDELFIASLFKELDLLLQLYKTLGLFIKVFVHTGDDVVLDGNGVLQQVDTIGELCEKLLHLLLIVLPMIDSSVQLHEVLVNTIEGIPDLGLQGGDFAEDGLHGIRKMLKLHPMSVQRCPS